MRSVVFDRHGDPARVLRLDADDVVPTAGPGEVLVRVLVRPLHPGDLAGVTGYSDSAVLDQPRSPGLEGMGVVEALGQGVTDLDTGARVVFFPVPGTPTQEAVAEVGRPGKVGTVLLTTPITPAKGNG